MGNKIPMRDNQDEGHLGAWRTSSHSMSNGHCVQTARLASGRIGVRDSKAVAGPVLRFEPAAWTSFVAGLGTSPFRDS